MEKIKIKRSEFLDTTAFKNDAVGKKRLLHDIKSHKRDVSRVISVVIARLQKIAACHDWTKQRFIDHFYYDLEQSQKPGSGVCLRDLAWFKHHVTNERHHINDHCPEDVNLFDLLERIADIMASGMSRNGEFYPDTISPEILTRAYQNTIKLILNHVEVVD